MPLKDLFADDYMGQANKGQLLYGLGQEAFEMLDETWQAYTQQDTERNFAKPFVEQDPFYGVSGILERLMTRANEIRHPPRWLAFG